MKKFVLVTLAVTAITWAQTARAETANIQRPLYRAAQVPTASTAAQTITRPTRLTKTQLDHVVAGGGGKWTG